MNQRQILNWAKQEGKFLYKLSFVFIPKEEMIEEVILFTQKKMPVNSILREDFKSKFIASFIKNCQAKEVSNSPISIENQTIQALFQIQHPIRQCVYYKYVLRMPTDEIARLLDLPKIDVEENCMVGLKQLFVIQYNIDDCSLIEKLLSYHEGRLSFQEYKEINSLIAENDQWSNSLEKLLHVLNELERFEKDLKPSVHFLVQDKPLTDAQIKSKKRNQQIITGMISFILLIGIIISSIGLTEIKIIWKKWSEESVAFGEKTYVNAIDKNVEIIITHVAADDLQTILFYELKGLNEGERYFADFQNRMFEIVEKDIWATDHFDAYTAPRSFHRVVDEENLNKGRLFLPPLKNKSETVTVRFYQVERLNDGVDFEHNDYLYNPKNRTSVDGEWLLEVPVTKYESEKIEINETFRVDGSSILVRELEIFPTATFLVYNLEKENDTTKQTHHDVRFSHMVANEKEYLPDFYMDRWGHYSFREDGNQVFTFESIYYLKPKELGILVDRITSHYPYEREINIDYNNIPMEFQFLDHVVTLVDIKIDNPTVYVLEEELVENRSYDQFHIDFNQQGLEFTNYGYGISSEGVWVDPEGNTYLSHEELEKLPNQNNLQYLTTKQEIEIYFHDNNWTKEMLPKQFLIHGYSKTHLINELINVRLE